MFIKISYACVCKISTVSMQQNLRLVILVKMNPSNLCPVCERLCARLCLCVSTDWSCADIPRSNHGKSFSVINPFFF